MLDFVRQRQRWAVGTLQALRLAQGPLRVRGLGWGQRLAYLEGALHWINTVPRLVLLLMPLAIGAVGVIPIRFTAADLVSLLLPLWLALLLGVGWLNRSSRHALLAELPGWALAIPLSATVLQALWGRVLPFRITPKHQVLERGGIDPLLGRPLLALLLLNGVNLAAIGLALGSGGANAQLGLGLLWAALNLLGLLVALRVCWDRPSPDPTPWLGLSLPATLQGPGGQQCQGQLTALSETGADLLLTGPGPGPVGSGWQLLLELDADANKALPPLALAPFPPSAAAGGRLSVGWDLQASAAVVELRRWLFSRPGAWPDRLAPPEWQALLALLSQLARRPQPPEAGRRSLVPQQHPPRPGPGGSGGR